MLFHDESTYKQMKTIKAIILNLLGIRCRHCDRFWNNIKRMGMCPEHDEYSSLNNNHKVCKNFE